jgi:hypothetical protein
MTPPPCDKHRNLQMVPFPSQFSTGQTFVHVCPVPSCARQHDDQGYFEVVNGQPVRAQTAGPSRIFSEKEKILMAIRARAGV